MVFCGIFEAPPKKSLTQVTKVISSEDAHNEIVDKIKVYMDGVIWDGPTMIEGSVSTINYLRSLGKKIYFCTNNSMLTRDHFQRELTSVGVSNVELDDVYSSSYVTGQLLKTMELKGKILSIGHTALEHELQSALAGVEGVELDHASRLDGVYISPKDACQLDVNAQEYAAVVMGFDPKINYAKTAVATMILSENSDCRFIATNMDLNFPANGRLLPGCGTFIGGIEASTNRRAQIACKPGPFVIDHILKRLQAEQPETPLDRSSIAMVGDNLLTDIDFGRANDIKTILVETGVHSEQDAHKAEEPYRPHFVLSSLATLQPQGEPRSPAANRDAIRHAAAQQ